MFRVIGLIDMDAFYASIEQRDRPELRGRPVIVGSPPTQRGVVCAASYEARAYGIHSAMPSVTAGRLCPDGVFIRPQMEKYWAESRLIMQLVADHGPAIEKVSVDEAYTDFSPFCQGRDADDSLQLALPLAKKIKQAIFQELKLTASMGIAPNKLLAKIASDQHKPDGLTVVLDSTKAEFLRPLPVRCLHGVGHVTAAQLQKAGILTIGDLQDYTGDLRQTFGSFGPLLKKFAHGHDERALDLSSETKSISSENTFLQDTADRKILRATLREQADDIAGSLRAKNLTAKTVQVTVRYSDFTRLTRQVTMIEPAEDAATFFRLGCHLLARHRLAHRPLRLIGLGVSNLSLPLLERQLQFFPK